MSRQNLVSFEMKLRLIALRAQAKAAAELLQTLASGSYALMADELNNTSVAEMSYQMGQASIKALVVVMCYMMLKSLLMFIKRRILSFSLPALDLPAIITDPFGYMELLLSSETPILEDPVDPNMSMLTMDGLKTVNGRSYIIYSHKGEQYLYPEAVAGPFKDDIPEMAFSGSVYKQVTGTQDKHCVSFFNDKNRVGCGTVFAHMGETYVATALHNLTSAGSTGFGTMDKIFPIDKCLEEFIRSDDMDLLIYKMNGLDFRAPLGKKACTLSYLKSGGNLVRVVSQHDDKEYRYSEGLSADMCKDHPFRMRHFATTHSGVSGAGVFVNGNLVGVHLGRNETDKHNYFVALYEVVCAFKPIKFQVESWDERIVKAFRKLKAFDDYTDEQIYRTVKVSSYRDVARIVMNSDQQYTWQQSNELLNDVLDDHELDEYDVFQGESKRSKDATDVDAHLNFEQDGDPKGDYLEEPKWFMHDVPKPRPFTRGYMDPDMLDQTEMNDFMAANPTKARVRPIDRWGSDTDLGETKNGSTTELSADVPIQGAFAATSTRIKSTKPDTVPEVLPNLLDFRSSPERVGGEWLTKEQSHVSPMKTGNSTGIAQELLTKVKWNDLKQKGNSLASTWLETAKEIQKHTALLEQSLLKSTYKQSQNCDSTESQETVHAPKRSKTTRRKKLDSVPLKIEKQENKPNSSLKQKSLLGKSLHTAEIKIANAKEVLRLERLKLKSLKQSKT